ncbi:MULTISPECIES: hypothetical protein [unclassified Ruminococcus]|uniref:hypothetical protein n=1 Tax=unclassified Ruminococcus TaxID=2608920 RepID=UPI00210B38DC|nr:MULTISPECIES: hypothetical protein [unclassified Ruminococcus]MCQ4021761.1 DUF4365 domain-containing protein [Ruminococcus sp. zg-924]MCQ4114205.1 DUF4365 domain-containing protein [Ruminococcus sp. zg-921]
MSNLGMSKHDITAFNESDAINLLSKTLESNHTIKTFFSANDKTPNHDGFFELVDEEHTPKKQFIVQIKKVENLTPNKQGENKGKYVYNLKTNFLYYVKEKVTESPAIYFVVDISANRIFWIYLSDEFLMDLNFEGHETVSYPFGDENILNDINQFTAELNRISAKRNALFCYKSREEIIELQDALDYINHLFDYDFCNIKKSMFPKLWRFGIKSSDSPISIGTKEKMGNPVNSSILALYPQIKGVADTGIQEYSLDNTNIFNHISLGGKINPMKYAKESVHKALKCFFEEGIPNMYLPDIVLQEKICPFIERTNKYFLDEVIETITTEEIDLRYKLILMYIDTILTSESLSKSELKFKSILINQFLHTRHSIDISSILSYGDINTFKKFYQSEKNKPFSIHRFISKILDKNSIETIDLIDEIKKRNIKEIAPVWKYEWYTLRQMEKDQFLSCINKITSEWLTNLPDLYSETYEKLIETSKYRFNNKIVYKHSCPDFVFGMNRFSTLIHKYDNKPFSIQYDEKIRNEFTVELKQDGLSHIIDGYTLDSFIDHKLLYFESLNCLIYKGICEKLEFEPKDLNIGSKSLSSGLSLF